MGQTKLGVTKEKTRDKIGSMIALYKTWRNKADETGWGLDVTCHDQVMENTRGNTIREVLIQKCPWYYQFEEIMGDSPTVSPPFLMESGHEDRETNVQDELNRNPDTQLYQDWVENGNNQDHEDDFEDEDFWSASQSRQNEGGKTKNIHDVTEDEISDDDFDLPTVQKLASSIPLPRTPIISGAKTDTSSHHIPQANVSGTRIQLVAW